MLNNLKKRTEGFTIIEVLIVLAIAGLILLIVFLAVPALQRNSRNTGIKNDAANVLAGANEFISNNNGQLPDTYVATNGKVDITCSAACGVVTQGTTASVRPGTTVTGVAAATWPAGTGAINIEKDAKCSGNTATTANTRSLAALFNVETGSGIIKQCLES